MIFTKEMIIENLQKKEYATLVTVGKKGLASRTMTFGYLPEDKIFMLTHKGTGKLSDISFSKQGLLHLSSINDNVSESFDISIRGNLDLIEFNDPMYQTAIDILGKKVPQVKDMLTSSENAKNNYQMFLLKITDLSGWNYIQVLSGEPKTVVI